MSVVYSSSSCQWHAGQVASPSIREWILREGTSSIGSRSTARRTHAHGHFKIRNSNRVHTAPTTAANAVASGPPYKPALPFGHHTSTPIHLPRRRRVPVHSHSLPPDATPSPVRRSHAEGRRRHEVLLPAAEGAHRRHQAHRRRLQEGGGGGGGAPEGRARAPPPPGHRSRRHRRREPAGGGAGAGGPGVRHGHAVRALPRPHPGPAPAPRRRARPRPAAGAPRPLRRRPALHLGGTRLGSGCGCALALPLASPPRSSSTPVTALCYFVIKQSNRVHPPSSSSASVDRTSW